MATPAPPPANGLNSSQYLRYLSALGLWNNLQENQQRNYPSVGEMYAVTLPHMLQQLAGNVGNIFTAQSADQTRQLQNQNLQSEMDLRKAQSDALQFGKGADLLRFQQAQAAQQQGDTARYNLIRALAPQTQTTTTPGPDLMSTAEPGNEMGQAPPIPTSTTSTTIKQPTFGEAFQSLGANDLRNLPKDAWDAYYKTLESPAQPKFGFGTGLGTYNQQTGELGTPVPEKPAPAPKAPTEMDFLQARAIRNLNDRGNMNPSQADLGDEVAKLQAAIKPPPPQSAEADFHVIARAQLMKSNGGVEPDPADVSQRSRDLALDFENRKVQGRTDITQAGKDNKPLTAKEKEQKSREENFLTTFDQLEGLARDHPEWFGPLGLSGRIQSGKLALGTGDPAFGQFESLVQQVGVERMHDLFGARLTQQEVDRYRESHPAMGQSLQQFLARLDSARAQMQNVYTNRFGGSLPDVSGGERGPGGASAPAASGPGGVDLDAVRAELARRKQRGF